MERSVAPNASADKSVISYQTARCLSTRSSHGRSPFKGQILTTGPVSEGMRAAKNEWVYLRLFSPLPPSSPLPPPSSPFSPPPSSPLAAADGLEQKRSRADIFD